ncbi:hypothetical protein GCM10028785_03280 [Hydrogenophaga soli]
MSRLAFVSLTAVAALLQGCAQRPLTMPYATAATNAAAPVVAPAPTAPAPTAPATVHAQPTPPVAPMVAPMPMHASTPSGGGGHTMNCAPITESQVAQLFDRWNASLMTHDPRKVVENYAPHSLLLPTVSNKPRYSVEDKIDYFVHFLHDGPVGKIDQRFIQVGCNTALDAGLYTFTFFKTGKVVNARYSYTYGYVNGQWLITSHHSSGMPEPVAPPPEAAPVHAPAADAHTPAPAKAAPKAAAKAPAH